MLKEKKPRLKLKKLMDSLPENDYNISKAARKAGYSDSYSRSVIYETMRRERQQAYLNKYFNEEEIKKDIIKAKKKFIKKNDNTNYSRMIELQTKILGMQIDKSEITNKNPDKCIVVYGNKISSPVPVADDKSPSPVGNNVLPSSVDKIR